LLNRLLSNDLELFVDFFIKLYLGIRDTSLCVCDHCIEKGWVLHALSFYVCLLLLVQSQTKI